MSAVKLVSAEGFVFIVDRKAACVSNTIKQMLSSEGVGVCCEANACHVCIHEQSDHQKFFLTQHLHHRKLHGDHARGDQLP